MALNYLIILLFFGFLPLSILAQQCRDSHELCKFWASRGECQTNPRWMQPNCGMACGVCSSPGPAAASASASATSSSQAIQPEIANAINRPIAAKPDCSEELQTRFVPTVEEYRASTLRQGCAQEIQENNCQQNQCFNANYRTFDGTCNNLQNTKKGAAFSPFTRLLQARYLDGVGEMFGSRSGTAPNPRLITRFLLSSKVAIPSTANGLVMQFGQFLSHDITHNTNMLDCNDCTQTPHCQPVFFARNDPKRSSVCVPFTRSSSRCQNGGPLVQMNENTAYIDGSAIYGSSPKTQNRFRNGAFMKTERFRDEVLPPSGGNGMVTGDDRSTLFLGLAAYHSIFVRLHNRMASQLIQLNPHWSANKVFQETRKIMGAVLQAITYNEFLPALLGNQGESLKTYRGYNPAVNPAISNEFAAAAYRLHGMIQEFYPMVDQSFRRVGSVRFIDGAGNFQKMLDFGVDLVTRGLMTLPARKPQRITTQVTEDFFGNFDLSTTNIQRGRDHGLSSYNNYRELCGLRKLGSFDQWSEVTDPAVRGRISELYNTPDEIDLYVGGIVEEPSARSLVGPTFSCIIAEQFTRLRDGDRFFYKNPGIFTPAQVQSINSMTMSAIICQTGNNFHEIPRNAFFIDESGATAQPCATVGSIDLRAWQEVSS
uniref:ShKT domain-containing protein n=1 Tax=Panagrolaimus sp. ES5 TaxID=591445 RepID=A0AC34F8R2_9BILA